MSAIGTVLAELGHIVSGSDLKGSPALDRLRALGVVVSVGHDPSNVDGAELVGISTAIGPDNPEVRSARLNDIPVFRRSELLGAMSSLRETVAVAGTHGKTTTSSMLTLVLIEAGWDPGFIVGGELNEIGSGASLGSGRWMVVEADESDGTFLGLDARAAVVTNVEPDHIDNYGSFDALVAAFEEFVGRVEGPVVLCADDPCAAALTGRAGARAVTYGTSVTADYRIVDPIASRNSVRFEIALRGEPLGKIAVPAPGLHVARNATGALAVACELGASLQAAVRALERFSGVARRFQIRGTLQGVTFVDDYAHLPGEIAATISAAAGQWDRIVCVFQPHRFSRIAALGETYGDAFRGAHQVVVTGIYPAGEQPVPGVTGEVVARSVARENPEIPVRYVPDRSELAGVLREILRPGDLCLVMSAGDMIGMGPEVYGQ